MELFVPEKVAELLENNTNLTSDEIDNLIDEDGLYMSIYALSAKPSFLAIDLFKISLDLEKEYYFEFVLKDMSFAVYDKEKNEKLSEVKYGLVPES